MRLSTQDPASPYLTTQQCDPLLTSKRSLIHPYNGSIQATVSRPWPAIHISQLQLMLPHASLLPALLYRHKRRLLLPTI